MHRKNIPEIILNEAHVSDNENSMRLDLRGTASTGQPVADHNITNRPDGDDDHFIDSRNDRGIDSVFINDFDEVFDAPQLDTRQNYLCAADEIISQFEENHNSSEGYVIKVKKKNEKINEYTNNDELLYSAFPWLFLFGRGLPSNGPLSKPFIRFLLQHYNQAFQTEHKFIFTLCNQLQRHAASRQSHARLYSHKKKSVQAFVDIINEESK